MHERPSTSGGVSSGTLQVVDFKFDDKRVSRDDFYVSLKPEGKLRPRQIFPPTGTTGLPTPEDSPKSMAVSQPQIPSIRLPTPESASDSSSIGMAIGSPVHQSFTASSSQPRSRPIVFPNPTSHFSVAESTVDCTISSDYSASKKPSAKWKLFGRFGKKHTESVSAPASKEMKGASRPREEGKGNVSRNNTISASKMSRNKPLARSATMPFMDESQPSKPSRPNNASTNTFRGPGNGVPSANGLLDVEIPNSNLERYSVMFGEVLKNGNGHSASSLLARRQANLNSLKTISDAIEHPEVDERQRMGRRATSPRHLEAPSFDLFPQPPASRSTPKGTSLTRSNTSPAMLRSPMRTKFEDGRPYNHLKDPVSRSQINRGKMTIATLARSRDQSVPRFNPEESSLLMDSPTYMEEGEQLSPAVPSPAVIQTSSAKPQIHEPKWEMINSSSQQLPLSGGSSMTSSRKRSPSSISSAQTHITKPSVDSETIRELTLTTSNTSISTTSGPEEQQQQKQQKPKSPTSSMSAVEQSIARQISMSREQRRMLKPLQTSFGSGPRPHRGATLGNGGKMHVSPLPTPKIAMGENERLVEPKLVTPTLVTPRETDETVLLQHRRSERIVLEG